MTEQLDAPEDRPARTTGPAGASRAIRGPRGQEILAKYGVLMALVLTIVVFSALKPDVFPTSANFKAIAEQFAPLAIIAFGMTVVLIMGDFDLSVAGMIGLSLRRSWPSPESGRSTFCWSGGSTVWRVASRTW